MELTIVVPAYNERDNLHDLLEELDQFIKLHPCEIRVLVVDDGSIDDTWHNLCLESKRRSWLTAVQNNKGKGMGSALKFGTEKVTSELVVWVMADRSDRLEDIREMYNKLMKGADLVVGSRAMENGSYGDFVGVKALGSKWFSKFARWILKLPVHDSTNAFRAFKRTIIKQLNLQSDDFCISPEMVFKAASMGLRVEEVPTIYRYRNKGITNFSILRMGFRYFLLTMRVRFARCRGSSGSPP